MQRSNWNKLKFSGIVEILLKVHWRKMKFLQHLPSGEAQSVLRVVLRHASLCKSQSFSHFIITLFYQKRHTFLIVIYIYILQEQYRSNRSNYASILNSNMTLAIRNLREMIY